MSDFYEKLAEHYDAIFPPEDEIVSFLSDQLRGDKMLLDLACGTGTYSEKLADMGFNVTGVDLDDSMIATAKAKQASDRTQYIAADMTDGVSAPQDGIDSAYCIGNSLPHLASIEHVAAAFRAWHGVLVSGGKLIVQIVNFDRFAVDHKIDLPSIERNGFAFERRYLPAGRGKVTFSTLLHVPGETDTYSNSIDLLVIGKDSLSSLLEDCGWKPSRFFGGYSGQPHDKAESFLTICVAEKT